MASATILMAILGCGDAGTACEQVSVLPVTYASVDACVAAQDDVLARTDIMYPVVTAQCRAAGSMSAALRNVPAKRAPATKRLLIKTASARS